MKHIIFTNSETLSKRYRITNIKSKRKTKMANFVNCNIERLIENKSSLDFLLNALLAKYKRDDIFIILEKDENIIGAVVLGYHNDQSNKEEFEVKSVCIADEHQNKGLSKLLVRDLFAFCDKNNISKINQSPYTKKGAKFLKKVFKNESVLWENVKFKDTSKRSAFG